MNFRLYDEENSYLFIPGPIEFHPSVTRVLSRKVYGHRTLSFRSLLASVHERLKKLFGTDGTVLMLTGSGTLAMDMAVRAFANKESRILNFVVGKFSHRFYEISQTVPHKEILTDKVEGILEWGQVFSRDKIKAVIADVEDLGVEPDIVTVCHNETSTGVIHDIKEFAELIKSHFPSATLIVDGITSVGAMPIDMDKWGIDVYVTGSQKCLETPPGLAFIALSPEAQRKIEKRYFKNGKLAMSELGGYYNALPIYLDSWIKKKDLPFTGAVSLFYALDRALDLILLEGLNRRFQRLNNMAKLLRKAVRLWGLKTLLETKEPKVEEKHYSPTVTAVVYPDNFVERKIDAEFRGFLGDLGILIAGGQSKLKGRIFRIATMGRFGPRELLMIISAIELALTKFGFEPRNSAASTLIKELAKGDIEKFLG